MADRPILFSAPMVSALLAGTKTQTRRLFKPRGFEFYTHPVSGDRFNEYRPYRDGSWDETRISGGGQMRAFRWGELLYSYLPIYPGDRLWVRETWAPLTALTHNDPGPQAIIDGGFYRADEGTVDGEVSKWKPSIFMPRHASRLTLTVTDVRVERLQDISEEDAIAEGIFQLDRKAWIGGGPLYGLHEGEGHDTAVGAYNRLWRDINGDGSWAANPWVVAYTFTVQHGNIDQIAKVTA